MAARGPHDRLRLTQFPSGHQAVLEIDGQDLRRESLELRKRDLGKLLRWTPTNGLQFN